MHSRPKGQHAALRVLMRAAIALLIALFLNWRQPFVAEPHDVVRRQRQSACRFVDDEAGPEVRATKSWDGDGSGHMSKETARILLAIHRTRTSLSS